MSKDLFSNKEDKEKYMEMLKNINDAIYNFAKDVELSDEVGEYLVLMMSSVVAKITYDLSVNTFEIDNKGIIEDVMTNILNSVSVQTLDFLQDFNKGKIDILPVIYMTSEDAQHEDDIKLDRVLH